MDSDVPGFFLDSEKTPQRKIDDLEVTGISRSGRVRKKSSKLVDFESNSDVAERPKKKSQHAQKPYDRFDEPGPSGVIPTRAAKNTRSVLRKYKMEMATSSTDSDSPESKCTKIAVPDGNLYTDSESDDTAMVDDIEAGFRKLDIPERAVTSQANSLYMLEKSKRRLIVKDGKTINKPKTRRKDKGKVRFTAYMLWSKDIRQKLTEQSPDMDFAAISKRLGELWSTVPNLEKCNWRRRAKRLVLNTNCNPTMQNETILKVSTPVRNKFINKNRIPTEPNVSTTARRTKQLSSSSNLENLSSSMPPSRHGPMNYSSRDTEARKVVGTDPIDVAAHLSLLSESLTVIGKLLMGYKGEVAISGGLSVLLDSLLCSLCILICLTKQLPEANGAEPAVLSKTLDNVAYIIPGL